MSTPFHQFLTSANTRYSAVAAIPLATPLQDARFAVLANSFSAGVAGPTIALLKGDGTLTPTVAGYSDGIFEIQQGSFQLSSFVQASDGGFVAVGRHQSSEDASKLRPVVLRLSSTLDVQWAIELRALMALPGQNAPAPPQRASADGVILAADGNFIIRGSSCNSEPVSSPEIGPQTGLLCTPFLAKVVDHAPPANLAWLNSFASFTDAGGVAPSYQGGWTISSAVQMPSVLAQPGMQSSMDIVAVGEAGNFPNRSGLPCPVAVRVDSGTGAANFSEIMSYCTGDYDPRPGGFRAGAVFTDVKVLPAQGNGPTSVEVLGAMDYSFCEQLDVGLPPTCATSTRSFLGKLDTTDPLLWGVPWGWNHYTLVRMVNGSPSYRYGLRGAGLDMDPQGDIFFAGTVSYNPLPGRLLVFSRPTALELVGLLQDGTRVVERWADPTVSPSSLDANLSLSFRSLNYLGPYQGLPAQLNGAPALLVGAAISIAALPYGIEVMGAALSSQSLMCGNLDTIENGPVSPSWASSLVTNLTWDAVSFQPSRMDRPFDQNVCSDVIHESHP